MICIRLFRANSHFQTCITNVLRSRCSKESRPCTILESSVSQRTFVSPLQSFLTFYFCLFCLFSAYFDPFSITLITEKSGSFLLLLLCDSDRDLKPGNILISLLFLSIFCLLSVNYVMKTNELYLLPDSDRDLKPGNILVSKDCKLRITDFGLARFVDEATAIGENSLNPLTEYVVTR